MDITINYTRTDSDPKSERVQVGWLYDSTRASVIFFPPERLKSPEVNKEHAKSASRCPAVLSLENRYVLIRCPYDLQIGFERDAKGVARLVNRLGGKSPVRASKLNQLLTLTNETEWRVKNRPIVQLSLPYIFLADEPVYLSQIAPFCHYEDKAPLPGTIFGGRFPIDVWPRPLMWAFEWHNTKKDIVLERGQPLFYCSFEFDNPERNFQLVEATKTEELERYTESISSAVNYVNQSFSLFKQARKIRPDKLLTKV
ncbi:hypothetical protein IWQ51_004198 [Labrenzia sp. EL_142]|nr:hypothetical protein [Labrenzia sp. EL_142]